MLDSLVGLVGYTFQIPHVSFKPFAIDEILNTCKASWF